MLKLPLVSPAELYSTVESTHLHFVNSDVHVSFEKRLCVVKAIVRQINLEPICLSSD